ncbi:MAG: DUF4019 domain-containing protein, partial [Alphaproteobacteria bacterium]|nr:DUF4019 domain-containing protein [Alphaproteobacteria bacterium]
ARGTAAVYLAAMDAGKYAEAYALIAPLLQKDETLAAFSDRVARFNARAGAVLERRITTVTWTKDSPNAPLPGTFVALDLVSRFANIDRSCGFLVLYQAPTAGGFTVMREENNVLDNATAGDIAKKSSPAAVDAAWANLSAHCPNYQSPLPEAAGPTIGYPSVAAALAALHAKPGVTFSTQDGWTVAEDDAEKTLWSFTPPGDVAYPAAVKRHLVEKDGAVYVEMAVQCEAAKPACDNLVRVFSRMNAQLGAGQGHPFP